MCYCASGSHGTEHNTGPDPTSVHFQERKGLEFVIGHRLSSCETWGYTYIFQTLHPHFLSALLLMATGLDEKEPWQGRDFSWLRLPLPPPQSDLDHHGRGLHVVAFAKALRFPQ